MFQHVEKFDLFVLAKFEILGRARSRISPLKWSNWFQRKGVEVVGQLTEKLPLAGRGGLIGFVVLTSLIAQC